MSYFLLAALLLLSPLAAAQAPGCLAVQDERITARDLAATVPAFAAIAPGTPLGFSPVPGTRRVFRASEIASLEAKYELETSGAADVCFEWPMVPLDRVRVLEAMRRSLKVDGATIEIIELSRFPVPPGELEFPRDKLGIPARPNEFGPVMWRGSVAYGGTRHVAVWARVSITARLQVVVAAENLRAGQAVMPAQVKLATMDVFPRPARIATSREEVTGKICRRAVAAGSQIPLQILDAAPDVDRGDIVQVEVSSGAMTLGFTGKAESAGRVGDLIRVRNPSSNKIFEARVSGRDKTVVRTGYMPGH